jgi:hypothetical protein
MKRLLPGASQPAGLLERGRGGPGGAHGRGNRKFQPLPPGTCPALIAEPHQLPAQGTAALVVRAGSPPPIATHGLAYLPTVWCRPKALGPIFGQSKHSHWLMPRVWKWALEMGPNIKWPLFTYVFLQFHLEMHLSQQSLQGGR